MKKIILTLTVFLLSSIGASAKWITIENGKPWNDTDGNVVQAHGGNFLHLGDTWYLIGEDRGHTWNPDVNMYSSKDFIHWKFEGKIIQNGVTSPELGHSRMIERPKLLYCKKTGKFVVWCHWESRNYGASEAAAFVSDKVNGPYKLYWSGRPMNIKSRDCNIFVDDDDKAYFISTTNENQDLGLFELSDDYLRPVSHTSLFEQQRREAPAIVRIDKDYYMISSACTGWDPNQAKIADSHSLEIGWSPLTDVGDRIAYDTQASAILRRKGTKGTAYIYVGDRWMDPDLPQSKIIMLPVEFKDGKMVFKYYKQWELDIEKGLWREKK